MGAHTGRCFRACRRTARRKARQNAAFAAYRKAGGQVQGWSGKPELVQFSHISPDSKRHVVEGYKKIFRGAGRRRGVM